MAYMSWLLPFGIVTVLVLIVFWANWQATRDVKKERAFMLELNQGHQFWCRAGVEKIGNCTCDTRPYLTVADMDERFRQIRRTAAKLV